MEHVEESISVELSVTIRLKRTHSKIHVATWPGFWTLNLFRRFTVAAVPLVIRQPRSRLKNQCR